MPSLFPAACDDTAAALSLTLPYIFNIFAPGSRQNTKEEDHSKMIKGKKKTLKWKIITERAFKIDMSKRMAGKSNPRGRGQTCNLKKKEKERNKNAAAK